MLQQMRKAQSWMIKGVLWAVVLAFVVTIFYSWGVRSSSGPTRSEVATILGEPIGVQEFQRAQNVLYQTYRDLFRNRPGVDLREQFNFREMALERIARQRLLLRIAQENNLVVTDAELYDRIASMPTFQEQGLFSSVRYQAVLRSQVPPIPLQKFEEEQRQAVLLEKVHDLIRATIQVTDDQVEQAYRWEHEQVTVRYATLVPSLFEPQVQVIEEELQAHYEAHNDTYREPERRKLRYMAISVGRFRSNEAIAQDEIEDYYATYQDAFQRQEQVRVRHILLKVAQDASEIQEAEIRAKAETILTELRGGADFVVLAKAHSEDTATTEKGGDLGFFPRGQMVKPFEQVAFTLPVGQLSDLVRTPFGYHILRVEDKIEPEVKPLLEVRQEVMVKLREEKARDAAMAFVDDLIVILEDDPGQFAALATQHGLSVVTTPFVAATGRIADLENVSDVVRRAFVLVGQAVDAVEGTDGTHYIFQVAEVQPSTIPEFAAVRTRVENDLRRQKSGDLARQTADDWAVQVQAGKSLSALATPLQVQVGETKAFSRNDPVPQLGRSATFNQIAFGLQPGETGAAHEGVRHFVIQVMTRQGADMSTYDAEKVAYREQLLRRKRQQTILAFQNSLQAQYEKLRQQGEIVVNSQYVF